MRSIASILLLLAGCNAVGPVASGPEEGAGMAKASAARPFALVPVDSRLEMIMDGNGRLMGTNENSFAVREPTGLVAIYSGEKLGAKGNTTVLSSKDLGPFTRVRVPTALVERARNSRTRTATVSLEDPAAGVEVVIRQRWKQEGEGLQDLVFRAGDPWVSGVVQVAISDTGLPLGLYRITRHHPPAGPDGEIGSSFFETGLADNTNLPPLKYESGATKNWPALPSNWR